jgi:hypothetical protein
MTDYLRELVLAESGGVMTASTGKESSHERFEWGHGAFTKAFIEGLEGKSDYDGNHKMYMEGIDFFVTKHVKTLTGSAQHPTTEITRTTPHFPPVYR